MIDKSGFTPRTVRAPRNRAFALLGVVALAVTPAMTRAQPLTPSCTTTPSTFSGLDACQKIADLFQFLAPQIGVALSGGNTMLGESGTLGTPGKSSVVVRLTAVDGHVPNKNISLSAIGAVQSSNFGAQRAPIPIPGADIAVSVFPGKAMGLTNVFGLDVLAGVTYVPDVNKENVSIRSDGRGLAFSYGLRLGILQESAAVPGVGISYRKRTLPTTGFGYTSNNDTLNVNRTKISSGAWRLAAGKHFKFVGLAAGVGRDNLESTSRFDGVINEPPPLQRFQITSLLVVQKVKRNTAFVNLSLGLPKAQLVGEMGWSSKGTIAETINTFDGHRANDGFRYYSIGFGFRY